jgi:hypothetical protein
MDNRNRFVTTTLQLNLLKMAQIRRSSRRLRRACAPTSCRCASRAPGRRLFIMGHPRYCDEELAAAEQVTLCRKRELSAITVTMLRAEGLTLGCVGPLRVALLGAAAVWSIVLHGRSRAMSPRIICPDSRQQSVSPLLSRPARRAGLFIFGSGSELAVSTLVKISALRRYC